MRVQRATESSAAVDGSKLHQHRHGVPHGTISCCGSRGTWPAGYGRRSTVDRAVISHVAVSRPPINRLRRRTASLLGNRLRNRRIVAERTFVCAQVIYGRRDCVTKRVGRTWCRTNERATCVRHGGQWLSLVLRWWRMRPLFIGARNRFIAAVLCEFTRIASVGYWRKLLFTQYSHWCDTASRLPPTNPAY